MRYATHTFNATPTLSTATTTEACANLKYDLKRTYGNREAIQQVLAHSACTGAMRTNTLKELASSNETLEIALIAGEITGLRSVIVLASRNLLQSVFTHPDVRKIAEAHLAQKHT